MNAGARFDPEEREFLETARRGFLATVDGAGRPAVVPVCFALVEGTVVTPLDEKPKSASPEKLRRVRDIRANPRVALTVDHYEADWSRLGWLQVRGTATLLEPDENGHTTGVAALREKYDQYGSHALSERPLIRIRPGHVVTWGSLSR